jgi:transposase
VGVVQEYFSFGGAVLPFLHEFSAVYPDYRMQMVRPSARAAMGIKKLQSTLNEIKGLAQNEGLIYWNSGAVDGSFSPWERRSLMDLLTLTACSAPANEDERKQVGQMIAVKTGKPGRSPQKLRSIAADKGYDSDPLRNFLKSKGIRPQIPRKKNASKRRGRPVSMKAPRFQVERTFSWLQRKFRRLVVRWERLPRCFDAFLSLAVCFMWMQRLLG